MNSNGSHESESGVKQELELNRYITSVRFIYKVLQTGNIISCLILSIHKKSQPV